MQLHRSRALHLCFTRFGGVPGLIHSTVPIGRVRPRRHLPVMKGAGSPLLVGFPADAGGCHVQHDVGGPYE